MFTSLSYFAFLMIALILALSLFVGLNKIQILQFLINYYLSNNKEGRQRQRLFRSRIALTNLPHLPAINY
uniref:Cytochrome b6-f complex subunit 6 n=2 Tax=Vittaria TaxID=32183 RepID=A0A3G5CU87_9MONI|nr:cytochrome b6/f complex 3.5 kDa subunit [Vittaria graminifolia]AYW16439.1 cytochrome b6/f complex 3.5 kDa subunit [Vittaria graminifolia]